MNKILLGILIVLLVVSIVLAIVCYCKNKDNYTQTSRETDNYHKAHYWRKIHLTTKDISKIPQYIFDKLHKYAKGFEYKIYNDKDCINYLEKHYGKKLVKLFNTLIYNIKRGHIKQIYFAMLLYCIKKEDYILILKLI